MDINDFEEKLIAKLEADLLPAKSIEVRSYPEDFNNYVGQMTHAGGAILVAWQGFFAEPPDGNSVKTLTQNFTHNWQFNVLQKNLNRTGNQAGIYARVEEIRTILSGFTPAGFDDSTVLFPVEGGFLNREKQHYIYQITMAHQIEESEV